MKVASAEGKKENKRGIMSGALIAFALCFTLFIYAPYELYVTNQLEFWFTAGQMPTGLNPEGTVLQFEWDHPEYGKQFVSASGMLHLEMIQKWLVRWRLVDKEHRE